MRNYLTHIGLISILLGAIGCGDFDSFDRRRATPNSGTPDRRIIINQGSGGGGGTQPDAGPGAPNSDAYVPPQSDGSPPPPPPPPPKQDSGMAPTPDTGTPPSTAPCGMNQFEYEVFKIVNQNRASSGKAAFQCDAKGVQVARKYSALMCSTGHFSHTGPDGSSPWTRLKAGGVTYQTAGENIAAGQTTPTSVMKSWMKSPGHRSNIMSGSYAYIGVGYAYCSNGYKHYWTQVFFK
jgi:uncharacterized protein YkwD